MVLLFYGSSLMKKLGKNKDFVLIFYCSFWIDPKNGGSILLQSVGKNLPVDMTLHPRRLESS
jgi:hypothetical protein